MLMVVNITVVDLRIMMLRSYSWAGTNVSDLLTSFSR